MRTKKSLDATSTQKHVDSLHDIILLRIVRVLFARDLQHGRNGFVVVFQNVSNIIGHVLIDQNNANIIAGAEFLKGFFNQSLFGVAIDNQKVAAVGRAMTNAR